MISRTLHATEFDSDTYEAECRGTMLNIEPRVAFKAIVMNLYATCTYVDDMLMTCNVDACDDCVLSQCRS